MILRSQNVRNQGMFKIGACPKYNGTQQVCEDQAGSYLRCRTAGRCSSTSLRPKHPRHGEETKRRKREPHRQAVMTTRGRQFNGGP